MWLYLLSCFADEKTCRMQGCHTCVGMGRRPCKDCAGSGNVSPSPRPPHNWGIDRLSNHTVDFPGSLTESLLGVQWLWLPPWRWSLPSLQWQGQRKVSVSQWGELRYSRCGCWTVHSFNDKHVCGYSCSHCHGQGSKQCSTCHGKQQLLVYINLTVKW